MAQAAGIAPKDVNYIPFDGGGELLASILGNKVAFGVSGRRRVPATRSRRASCGCSR